MTTLTMKAITMPGVRLGDENPLPHFRDIETDRNVALLPNVPAEKHTLAGWETGVRVLPYTMQDSYTRQRTPMQFQSIWLENENIRAIFLPELGGRLISLVYKPEDRELLNHNPVFQPANLAIRNAWFSGGIEWNIGQLGHTFDTCSPIFSAQINGLKGEPALRFYGFERCKGLFWQIDFFLPDGSEFLIAHTRVMNPNPKESSMYWWTNTAVPEAPDVRVLAPTNTALYLDHASGGFGLGTMPFLPSLDGDDASYSLNFPFANEYFLQCEKADLPWETALDGKGCGFIEASTPRLAYRKMFCWGSHQGGRHWQEFLSPGGETYLEIQAGLAPTQIHGLVMPPNSEWDWMQVFGYMQADAAIVHGADWQSAWQHVDALLKSRMPVETMNELQAQCAVLAVQRPQQILTTGSGWGALEMARRMATTGRQDWMDAFDFPMDTMGSAQQAWLGLLKNGCYTPSTIVGTQANWMVQDEWFDLLRASLSQVENENWAAWLHLGVMLMERFDLDGAEKAWERSIALCPNWLAYRNLAVAAQRRQHTDLMHAYYQKAWQTIDRLQLSAAFAREYLHSLWEQQEHEQALAFYNQLPSEIQEDDRVQIYRAFLALHFAEYDLLEKILQREFAIVREGETNLTDIWFEMWAKRLAAQKGKAVDDEIREAVKQLYPPPASIDFRSISS